ncbi:MAG: DUF305 domain-containing protein [Chloroflexota bacterium]|jgi:uncharacterized protein (DUF305 family)
MMMTEELPPETSLPRAVHKLDVLMLLSFAVLLVSVAVLAFWLGTRQSSAPGENSPEAGFARDMMMHHAQAVDMATLLRDRTEDPEMRQLALDIMLTQQAQIGQMQGWLAVWQYPIASTDPAMMWMDMPVNGGMPGMATQVQLNELRELQGVKADGLFLQLMIVHHRGGVLMGEAALESVKSPEVLALAQSIVNAQTSEIAAMQDLLARKGFPPVMDEPKETNHEGMSP